MDLLCKSYSNNSDDDDEEEDKQKPCQIIQPPLKRQKPLYYSMSHKPVIEAPNSQIRAPNSQIGAPNSPVVDKGSGNGRYISKREKALMAANSSSSNDYNYPNSLPPSIEMGSISRTHVREDVLLSLRKQTNTSAGDRLPCKLSIDLHGHLKPVNTVQWSTSYAHLLASAGMDNTVCIWNVWSEQQKKVRVLNHHNAAVKDVRWSPLGQFILSCGYDCSSRLVDIEKGSETQSFTENQAVTAVKFHPHNPNLFLSGGSKGCLKLWDIRAGKVVHEYVRRLGPILDVEFMNDGKQFISSSDVSQSNLSENSVVVWDVAREVPLSNQVYVEAYTCPCVKCHPFEASFVAQSNGNYIAIFSTKHPFRLDKYKRYESHGVFGFPIKCCFNMNGEVLASGSSDGEIHLYSVKSSNLLKKIKVYNQPCIDVAFHPVIPNVIACCSWSGNVSVIE